MTLLDNPIYIDTAVQYLDLSLDQVPRRSREIPELDAVYFWESKRGGGALIVGADGSMLYATSSVPFDPHVAAFADGRRTHPSEFG